MRRTAGLYGVLGVVLGVVAAFLALPAVASAEPAGNPFNFAREVLDDPEVASAQSGRALAVGITEGEPALQVLTPSAPFGSRLQTAVGARGYGGRVVANPRLGQYLHVWTAYVYDDNHYQVTMYSQRRDAAGAALGDPIVLKRFEFGIGIWAHDVVWNQRTRRYLVLWTVTDDAPVAAVEAMLLDESGAPISEESLDDEGYAPSAAVAVRPTDGSYLVTWSEWRWNGSAVNPYTRLIRGQRLDVTGRRSGAPFLVSAHSNLVGLVENEHPSIAIDPETGEGIVAWTDQYEVFARRINASGAPTGPDLWLSRMGPPSDPAWLTRSPDIAYNAAAKQYVVVWQSGPARDPYPAGEVVYGQHLNRAGGQIGANDFVIATRDRAIEPSVTALAGGSDFLVVWSSHFNGRSAWARRITPTTQGVPANPPESNPTPDRPPVNPPVPSRPTIPGTDIPLGGPTGPPIAPPNAGSPTVTGAPASPTQPGGSVPARSFGARVLGGRRMRAFTRTGLRAVVTCPSACRATVRLTISRRDARLLRTSRTLARRFIRITDAGSATVTLRPPDKAVRRIRRRARLNATLSVKSIDSGGVVHRAERRVRLVR